MLNQFIQIVLINKYSCGRSLSKTNVQNIILSQCSTVVHNTVVRATIKVNGKPQILGTRCPQTPESIDLKSDLDDYVSSLTLRAKNGTNRPSRVGGAKGSSIVFNWVIFYFFFYFSCQALGNIFLGVSPYSLHWIMCFGGDSDPAPGGSASVCLP